MPVTREQAQMLTTLAVACRPNGAPHWDAAGVMAEIGKVKDRSLVDVILAVTRAADDRNAKTPGVISATGSTHWRERSSERLAPQREPFDRGGCCHTCSLPYDKCRRVWADDHDYVSVAEYAKTATSDPERIRRILQAVKAEKTPMREPAKPREANPPQLDHEHCEQAINDELAKGHEGKAEFLAELCDRRHGDQTDA